MEKELLDITKQEILTIVPSKCLNINVGVLGHVDSGKTFLCRILSNITSTASLDKNPQSQERGITLDLGFSAFFTRVPTHLTENIPKNQKQFEYLQFTLVDCPGHASLIKTIIGGAQIIDLMFLIIDINKGIQPQTAECIIIAELFMKKVIVVLNKVDMIDDHKIVDNKIAALRKVFAKTKLGENVTIIKYSTKAEPQKYAQSLKENLLSFVKIPSRNFETNSKDQKFLYMIDHCFKIKGKGTVITGTVIEGKAKPGDEIEICELQQKCKIKSMQMFRKPIQVAKQGDRVAMLMQHLDNEQVERGIACNYGYLKRCRKFVIDLHVVRLFKRPIKNKSKFNIMSGHQTAEGELRLFQSKSAKFDINESYLSIPEIDEKALQQAKQLQKEESSILAVVSFEKDFYINLNFKIIGYKPDIDYDEKACRLAFHGAVQEILNENSQLKLYKEKTKYGEVDRVTDNYSIIIKGMFDKQTNINVFIGKEVILQDIKIRAKIESSFGKSGKVKALFKESIEGMKLEGLEVSMPYTKWYH